MLLTGLISGGGGATGEVNLGFSQAGRQRPQGNGASGHPTEGSVVTALPVEEAPLPGRACAPFPSGTSASRRSACQCARTPRPRRPHTGPSGFPRREMQIKALAALTPEENEQVCVPPLPPKKWKILLFIAECSLNIPIGMGRLALFMPCSCAVLLAHGGSCVSVGFLFF